MTINNSGATVQKITKDDLKKVFWRSLFDMASINYERFQALGFLFSMSPIIKKLYSDDEQRQRAMKRHLEMYNSHPWMMNPILGVTIALEEQNAKTGSLEGTINNVKVGLMGPFAGIGDSLIWGTLRPLLAGIGAAFALQGSILGPIIFLLAWNIINFSFRWYSLLYGYNAGMRILKDIKETNIVQKIAESSSVLGLMVLGVLVAQWVNVKTGLALTVGDKVLKVQEMLDDIMPSMLPLITTFVLVWFLRKRVTPNKLIIGIFVVALVLSLFKILI
ncbi:PTS system mannose/fructose/sorbose family transporter subunit IID [Caldanaerobacter sp.]|uniref:PTS system mannose/fructose/sorbose family transporter subunit IID n=1 Tax=Caldanaerobacter sp. TaxID=2930036 RepID=UPI003C744AF4